MLVGVGGAAWVSMRESVIVMPRLLLPLNPKLMSCGKGVLSRVVKLSYAQ